MNPYLNSIWSREEIQVQSSKDDHLKSTDQWFKTLIKSKIQINWSSEIIKSRHQESRLRVPEIHTFPITIFDLDKSNEIINFKIRNSKPLIISKVRWTDHLRQKSLDFNSQDLGFPRIPNHPLPYLKWIHQMNSWPKGFNWIQGQNGHLGPKIQTLTFWDF